MRTIPVEFAAAAVVDIDERLDRVRREHGVAVPWAIESGSRAWGFPSPDSDYDCRFLFVRPIDAYLDPWPVRDVIETPLVGLIDANGWDLSKAVRLAAGGNATVGEWLRSPYVYSGEPAFRDELLALVDAIADRGAVRRHYRHVGRSQWERSGAAAGRDVSLKRAFYAIRPAATLRWLDAHPDRATPPMSLSELVADVAPPADVATALQELLAAKAVTREMGHGRVPVAVARWVTSALAGDDDPPPGLAEVERSRVRAADGFRRLLRGWAPD